MDNHSPKYIAIYHMLKNDILSGKYPAGSFLPPEGELEKIYSASRTTIRSAVSMLKNDNMVDVCQGRGTEVLATNRVYDTFNFPSFGQFASVSKTFLCPGEGVTSSQPAIIDTLLPDTETAEALGISAVEPVYRIQRVKFIDDAVFCYAVSYVPCALAPDLDKYNNQIHFLYKFLYEHYNLAYSSSHMCVSAVNAGFLESKLLNVQPGSPLVLTTRLTSSGDTPFEYGKSYMNPELVEVTIDFNDLRPMF